MLKFEENISLKNFTTYKIGGPAKYFFVARTKEDLILAIKEAKKIKVPIFILGGGSNLLVSENGFKGLVIKIEISDIKIEGNKAYVGAGANITKLAYLTAENKLSGFEWAAGVPGTVGGSIYGNAQAFGTKISEAVESVTAINSKNLKIKTFTKQQCKFSLKESIFKKFNDWIIISAILKFQKESPERIKERITGFLEYRRAKHPMTFPSAGSVFVNPEIKITNKKLLEKFPELNEYNKNKAIPAGYLISSCGLAGKRIGDAQISGKHCNFIINLGGAKAKDVISLIKLAQKEVKKKFKINLITEIQCI